MFAIVKKELRQYFTSPMGYIYIAMFMFVSGIFFSLMNIVSGSADMTSFLSQSTFVFLLVVPFLTMRLFAEEKSTKTDQLLFTSPMSTLEIVLGKAFSAFAFFGIIVILMLIYPIVLSFYDDGGFAWGVTFSNYIGFFLMGCSYISIGLFVSSLTENQIISAAITFAVLLILYIADAFSSFFTNELVKTIIGAVAINTRFNNDFAIGYINLPTVVYYITVISVFIFLTHRRLELRKIAR